jgi:UDP-N-acetylglucosamine:LPS N-acetylglucosamine transferase
MALQRQGAAQIILDAELTGARLYEVLEPLLRKPELLLQPAACSYALGRPQAADAIVTACLRVLCGTPAVAASASERGKE